MNLLTVKKGNKRYDLQIGNIKYCIGNNFEEKYNFINILKETFLSSKESEYSINNSGEAQVLINDKEIKLKEINFYYINHNYSIINDLKLTTHSLITKYLEILIAQDNNTDTINTVNLLLESFTNELDNELIYPRFITYTPKQFLKILLPIFLKEENQANEYDLSYNEIILFQLKMINYISNHQSNKILCLIELPLLTQEIDDYLKKMKNCINVVMIYKTNNPLLYRNIYLFDDQLIDLNDEQQIYNLYLNKGICTLQEAQQMIINNINNKLDISITKQ